MKQNTTASEKSKILMRTYITSLLSLMLCVTMLLGTTYAWFTSEVTTAGNEIMVGTMLVDMVNDNNESLADKAGLFGSGKFKWEPGATQIETVKVVNYGDLSFDYAVYLSTLNANVGDLAKVGKYIDVYITTNGANAANAQDLKDKWIRIGNLADVARNGYMLANGSCTTPATTKEVATVKIALHMPAEVSDTSIMGKKIENLGIRLMASQKVYEEDAFGSGYDAPASVDVQASTFEELAAAITAGKSVRLLDDIAIPEDKTVTVPSGKSVFIDMDGYDIESTSNGASGNKELFLVKGNLVIKGQKDEIATVAEGEQPDPYKSTITYTHKGGNMEWNAMSTIFDITAGGSVQLEDMKLVNGGGTDMSFVAHLNNWGSASLYMEGCYLEAPYCAVRVFNSGNDMNNVVARNTTLKGKHAFWVHNYTEADFGAKYDAEAIDARLNINIYNGKNTIDGNVIYGFTGTEYHVTSGTAFAECVKKGVAKIVLEDEVTFDKYTCEVEHDLVVDLNGYDISATQNPTAEDGTTKDLFLIKPGVNMTVEGEGKVKLTSKVEGNNNISVTIFRNQGNLTINGGSYEVADSTVKVAGAQVVATIVDSCLYAGDAVTTINGGEFAVTGNAINLFRNFPTHNVNVSTKLIINDGTFIGNPEKLTYIWNHQNNGTYITQMEFNGGTYVNNVVYEDYFGQTDIFVSDAAAAGGLNSYSGNN